MCKTVIIYLILVSAKKNRWYKNFDLNKKIVEN